MVAYSDTITSVRHNPCVATPIETTAGRGAAGFAVALRQQYARQPRLIALTALELLRTPRRALPQVLNQTIALQFAPRIDLTLPVLRQLLISVRPKTQLLATQASLSPLTLAHAPPVHSRAAGSPDGPAPTPAPQVGVHLQLRAAAGRVEQRAAATPELVVRRGHMMEDAAVRPALAQSSAPTAGFEAPARTERSLRPAAAAEIDIGRLADQVIRQIDQRVVAQRERRGRW